MKSRVYSWLLAVLVLTLCAACGGHKNSAPVAPSDVRLVNATKVPGLALTITSTVAASVGQVVNTGVGVGGAGSYTDLVPGSYTMVVSAANGAISASNSQSITFTTAVKYTVFAYERNGAIIINTVSDSQTAPGAGFALLTFGNPGPDAGSLDVYVAPVGGDITNLNPNPTNLFAGSLSQPQSISAGTYDIIVTAFNKPADVRLKLSSVVLADQEIASLFFTPTVGGALVDATLVLQGGAVTSYPTAQARLRVMATVTAVTSSPAVVINLVSNPPVGATPISYQYPFVSPKIDNLYSLVAGGTTIQSVTVTVNGSPPVVATVPTAALVNGGDYTVVVSGTPAAPQVALLTDNNQAPGSAKIRLLNVAVPTAGGSGVVSLIDNNVSLVSQLPNGTASPYSAVNTGTSLLIASTPDQVAPLYTSPSNLTVLPGGVYSLVIGGTFAVPYTQFIKDR